MVSVQSSRHPGSSEPPRLCRFGTTRSPATDVTVTDENQTGQDLYFHGNHPIKWVRVVGIVVAVDEYGPRRIYTVDDSSGATIECAVDLPRPDTTKSGSTLAQQQQPACKDAQAATEATSLTGTRQPNIDGDVDVGHILDVRGSIRVFRHAKQVRVDTIIHMRSTEQEVRFWNKLTRFREDVLDLPWVLDRKEVRRCRREAEGPDEAEDRRRRKHRTAEARGSTRPVRSGTNREGDAPMRSRTTGLEKKVKRSHKAVGVEGKYDALGI